jgi:hypothetical protein
MKTPAITSCCTALGLIFWVLFPAAGAQLEIVTNAGPQCIFSGATKNISVTFHNPDDKDFEDEIHARIFQTSSATTVQLSEIPWKKLQVLPGQTVLESVQLDFPGVKAETKFLVQWLESTNHVIGKTEVLVYPTNLLEELKPLSGDEPFGVFDPQNRIKPLLKNLKLEFADLENSAVENFSGKFAVIGPFPSKAQMREELANQIRALAKKNVAVVWIQPPPEKRDKPKPSFYYMPERQVAVVIVQPELVSNLPQNPQSQLNLIYFCKLALNPESPTLPGLPPP